MINETILLVAAALGLASMTFAWVLELRRDLMMMQQNSYRPERYMRWLRSSGDTTSWVNLAGYVILLASFNAFHSRLLPVIVSAGMIVLGVTHGIKLLRAKYKKPLVMTARAKRLFVTALVLGVLAGAVAVLLSVPEGLLQWTYNCAVAITGCFCLAHVFTLGAVYVTKPIDRHINNKFITHARRKIADMPDLKIVGITGSYGKTSTKHYLERILAEHYETLITPGSFNTTLGVTRTINEMLQPYHQVFVVEMGAKQRGDIREICQIVSPQIGIVTAVGPQHLETFGSIENVRDTKFELIDALPTDGLAVVNNDFEQIAGRKVDNVACVRYGVTHPQGCNYTVRDLAYNRNGTRFTLEAEGHEPLMLETTLLGDCNISNLMAAVAVARQLGVPDSKIKIAVRQIEPVEHRLSRKTLPGGLTIIDDAFNSNPSGSRMALDVLAAMTPGNRFLITPGMIELGSEQYHLNKAMGCHASQCCDYACIVGTYNHDALAEGLTEGGMDADRILSFATFPEAFAFVLAKHKVGDTVLIENDLPDTFK